LNILTSSDRLTGSHIFYCLVINFIRGFEFMLVVWIEPGDFLSKLLDLSNRPLTFYAFVAIDDLFELYIPIIHTILGLPSIISGRPGFLTHRSILCCLFSLGEQRTSFGLTLYTGLLGICHGLRPFLVWSRLEWSLVAFLLLVTCLLLLLRCSFVGFRFFGGCCRGEKSGWSWSSVDWETETACIEDNLCGLSWSCRFLYKCF
jgi:hypothetical protein